MLIKLPTNMQKGQESIPVKQEKELQLEPQTD